jgi:hypothetical protein
MDTEVQREESFCLDQYHQAEQDTGWAHTGYRHGLGGSLWRGSGARPKGTVRDKGVRSSYKRGEGRDCIVAFR